MDEVGSRYYSNFSIFRHLHPGVHVPIEFKVSPFFKLCISYQKPNRFNFLQNVGQFIA